MIAEQELTVAEIVSSNIKSAHIFKKFGIDFCCGGGVTLEKACEKKNISPDLILQELSKLEENVLPSQNFNNWGLDFLADYIVHTHHSYVVEALDLLDAYGTKVAKVHGEAHPQVIKIQQLITKVIEELTSHMEKEEIVLFPFIKKLEAAKKNNTTLSSPPFKTIINPIDMMEDEHELVGNLFKEIAELSNNYIPPDWACNTFKALYSKLDEFEQDLHIHIHLENNILFPKAIELEKTLNVVL